MAERDRRLIKVGTKVLDHCAYTDGPLSQIRENYDKLLRNIREEYGFTIEEENVQFYLDTSSGYDGWVDTEIRVEIHRRETHEEVEERLEKSKKKKAAARKAAATRKKKKDAEELELFKKLKKKYEPA